MLSPLRITPEEELLSIDVALIESVSAQVQYSARPNMSRTMWNGLLSPDTTADDSVMAEVTEYDTGTRRIEWESSSIQ